MSDRVLKHLRESESIIRRWKEIRQTVIRRKSAYTIYEWIKIKEFLNITE
jgi:hypothetical protein